MIKNYSNKISRESAKKIKIIDEIKNCKDINFEKLFKNFQKRRKNIYKILSNYDYHGKLPIKDINENYSLSYCLNDNLEDGYWKFIATAYKDFITYQNVFLKPLIENNLNNQYLYSYSNQIKKEIILQKERKQEIVSIEKKIMNLNLSMI